MTSDTEVRERIQANHAVLVAKLPSLSTSPAPFSATGRSAQDGFRHALSVSDRLLSRGTPTREYLETIYHRAERSTGWLQVAYGEILLRGVNSLCDALEEAAE